ncbi:MAG: cation transporter dimerization domain-containing protein, partial [Spirochaetota bacterium]
KSGKMTHIDFHLTVPDDMTVKEAHDICDKIEESIARKIRNSKVLIHTESCGLERKDVLVQQGKKAKKSLDRKKVPADKRSKKEQRKNGKK